MCSKHLDSWYGHFPVQAGVGRFIVTCLNPDTKKDICFYWNDLRDFKKSDTLEWRISDSEMIERVLGELDLGFGNLHEGYVNTLWKSRKIC
jgi:hypothetical protein